MTNEARILRRPAGLLPDALLRASGWAVAFGGADVLPSCSHCGACLTRVAVIVDGGDVWGLDCAATAGLVSPRRAREAREARDVPLTPSERRALDHILAESPDLFARLASLPVAERREAWLAGGGNARRACAAVNLSARVA